MSKPKTQQKARKSAAPRKNYQAIKHQHILLNAPPSKGKQLVCVLRGCKYAERWNDKRGVYEPVYDRRIAGVSDEASVEQVRRTLARQQREAIRPQTLWGEGEA